MSERDSFRRRTVLKATGAVGLAATAGVTGANPGRSSGPRTDEVLVGVSAGADMRDTVRPHVPEEARITHDNGVIRYVAVAFNENADENARENFKRRVRDDDQVKYAEDNTTQEAFYTPNDPRYDDQYADQMVNSDAAWETTLGDGSVVVGVVDQGVQYDHPDLDGNMVGSESNHGQDFVDDDENPYPDDLSTEYHGTHVAGIAAGEIDNSEGVTGIGQSSVLAARALSEEGTGSTSDIADAITWATDRGVDVINLSLGGGGYTETMKNAVSYAYDNGVFLAAAAGNDGQNSVSYPAAYSECLAVSALDPDGSFASYSNYGEEIELCAPGTDVLSTTTPPRGDYERLSGTSMATPVVAGTAGLTLAQWDVTNTELRTHLTDTAVDVGLSADKQGSGRVDADNAVDTDPSGGGGGGSSTSGSVSDTLTDYADYDCWEWTWEYADPTRVEVDLSGPSDADFDLFVSTAETDCPGPYDYDYASYSTDSQEFVAVDGPLTSSALQICVDSYSGSGAYTLAITEYE